MSTLSPLFLDLAMILITAGVITIIFKWLKQPLVLGYIVAGFFIGPYFPWFPVVSDAKDVQVWSEIGVVFLMFAVGLEFSLKKLKKVGATGGITAVTELFLMFLIGSSLGRIMGWSSMDSVFLGCMLAISSTAIIIKSFEDLKLKQQKFTGTVTAVLVVEDIIAVLLLVVLGTLSVSKQFDGIELGRSLIKLAFFLIVWFVFGIYLLPTFLRYMRRFMTEETLCIVSVGLCFAMVVFASYVGFSTALGAFVMGAVLAETIEADAIHRIITPIKNLFSAVFFVSVGMLVNPAVLLKYFVPIIVIALTVIVFKSLSATTGIILSGKPARTAIQSGFCFCQIGEFSFIIANVGLDYGVINPDLYPIIVSVSIITTFATPYMIKGALPFYENVYPRFPVKMREAIDNYSARAQSGDDGEEVSVRKFVQGQLTSVMIYGVIMTALMMLSSMYVKPLLNNIFVLENGQPSIWGNVIGLVVTLVVMLPFLWAIVFKNVHRHEVKAILEEYNHSRAIVVPILLLRYFVAMLFVGMAVGRYIHLALGFVLVIVFFILFLVMFSRRVMGFYKSIEGRFMANFNQRQDQHSFKIPQAMADNFMMESVKVTAYSPYVGKRLVECAFRKVFDVNVVAIERAGKVINLPGKDEVVMPLDKLTVIGAEDRISQFRGDIEVEPDMLIHDHSDNEVHIYRYEVREEGPLCGKDLIRSDFQRHHNGMIIAIERDGEYVHNPPAQTVFCRGDVVWFVSPDAKTLEKFDEE